MTEGKSEGEKEGEMDGSKGGSKEVNRQLGMTTMNENVKLRYTRLRKGKS